MKEHNVDVATLLISLNDIKSMIVNVYLNIDSVIESNLFVPKGNGHEYNCSSNFNGGVAIYILSRPNVRIHSLISVIIKV